MFIADCFWPVKGPRRPERPRAPTPTRDASKMDGKKNEEEEEEEEEEEKREEAGDGESEVKGDQTVRKRKTESDATQADKTS